MKRKPFLILEAIESKGILRQKCTSFHFAESFAAFHFATRPAMAMKTTS
jgi:hypothetical protein